MQRTPPNIEAMPTNKFDLHILIHDTSDYNVEHELKHWTINVTMRPLELNVSTLTHFLSYVLVVKNATIIYSNIIATLWLPQGTNSLALIYDHDSWWCWNNEGRLNDL